MCVVYSRTLQDVEKLRGQLRAQEKEIRAKDKCMRCVVSYGSGCVYVCLRENACSYALVVHASCVSVCVCVRLCVFTCFVAALEDLNKQLQSELKQDRYPGRGYALFVLLV